MGKKIMIIEDDQACAMILQRVIQTIDATAEIDFEENVERLMAALDKKSFKGDEYDLIITDIFLTGKRTGLEFYQACRELFPDVTILILSSLSPIRFFQSIGTQAIAPPFLSKPFHCGECTQMIEGLLSYH